MSTNLFWRPLDKGTCLSKELKFILRDSGFFVNSQSQTLSEADILPLKIIRSSTSNDQVKRECDVLIGAIGNNTEIEIYIE